MPPSEVAWRLRSSLRDGVDRALVGSRQRLRPLSAIMNASRDHTPGFRVCGLSVGAWGRTHDQCQQEWRDAVLARADQIARHRLSFFDQQDRDMGDPVVWNRDHKRGLNTPVTFSCALDYRDVNKTGDSKFVWEPNRHHQFVVLGRAYRASSDVRFALAVAEQLDGWLLQNPFGMGMNWRAGLELGIRLINWVWAIDLIWESEALGATLQHRLLDSVARHIWEIDRKYSQGSSAGNHLIGEAAGVFVATSYFQNLRHATRWRNRSWEILTREIVRQTYPDGGPREHTTGYHLFILQFFILAGIVARVTGWEFPECYWVRLKKMCEYLAILREGGEPLPAFGDSDDGYVLDLGQDPHSVQDWLAVGATLFPGEDFTRGTSQCAEPIEWLPGASTGSDPRRAPVPQCESIRSTALHDSGCYILQWGHRQSPDRISVAFDCGPLGLEPLAGHGHADALSFTLRAFGREVLVDPGTYDYFSYPEWRRYFRGTSAHNTVVVDGLDQSEMLGLFLWGRKARARCLCWEPSKYGGRVMGEHDGYTHLEDPVIHRRTLELDGRQRTLLVRDDILAHGSHDITVCFHLAEHCRVTAGGGNRFLIDVGPGTVEIELDPALRVGSFRGSEDPICGWISRGYHRKVASTTLVGQCTCDGDLSLICRIGVGEQATGATLASRADGINNDHGRPR